MQTQPCLLAREQLAGALLSPGLSLLDRRKEAACPQPMLPPAVQAPPAFSPA